MVVSRTTLADEQKFAREKLLTSRSRRGST